MFFAYAILSYFAWAYIHEYAHLIMAKRTIGVKSYTMRIYPHQHPTLGFVFASVSYEYEKDTISKHESALISFAPRIPDLLAILIFPATAEANLFWIVMIGGGLIDMIRGSFIFSPTSDIKRYCDGWGLRYEDMRATQLSLVAISLCLFGLIYL